MTLIARYLLAFQFVERHRLRVSAAPAVLLDAVTLPDIIDDPWVSRFIRIRELPGRLLAALRRGNALKNRAAFGLRRLLCRIELRLRYPGALLDLHRRESTRNGKSNG
jgi:hypothetical protein